MTENSPAPAPGTRRSAPPTIESPREGHLVHDRAIALRWTPVADAEHYQVQVAADSKFDDVLAAVTTRAPSITLYDTIAADGMRELHWRVAAGPSGGWSESAAFRAADEQTVLAERQRMEDRMAAQARAAIEAHAAELERIPLVTPEDSRLKDSAVVAILATVVLSFVILMVILMIYGQVVYPSEAVIG